MRLILRSEKRSNFLENNLGDTLTCVGLRGRAKGFAASPLLARVGWAARYIWPDFNAKWGNQCTEHHQPPPPVASSPLRLGWR